MNFNQEIEENKEPNQKDKKVEFIIKIVKRVLMKMNTIQKICKKINLINK